MGKRTDWRTKLYPIFFELAEFNLQFEREWKKIQTEHLEALLALGKKPNPELWKKSSQEFRAKTQDLVDKTMQQFIEIDKRHRPDPIQYNPIAYSYLEIPTDQSPDEAYNLAAYIHFSRHGESLRAASAKDEQGDIKAWQRIARTGEDFRRTVHNKGGIKPFQGDEIHRQLLEIILCFEKERLTAEELAEWLDRYCACGRDHDASAARKQLARLRKELETAAAAKTRTEEKPETSAGRQSTPKPQRRRK